MSSIPGEVDLTFNLANGLLTGKLDGYTVNARAASGGRGNSKTPGAERYFLVNNFFSSHVKLDKADPLSVGGTLPLGLYRLKTHEWRKNWIRLSPAAGTQMGNRDGMAIHGRGLRGSDGCIVPGDFHVVTKLYELTRQRESDGRPYPLLRVEAVGTDVDKKLRQSASWV